MAARPAKNRGLEAGGGTPTVSAGERIFASRVSLSENPTVFQHTNIC
jgi:hypothetical protein